MLSGTQVRPGEGPTVQWNWSLPSPGSLKALLFPALFEQPHTPQIWGVKFAPWIWGWIVKQHLLYSTFEHPPLKFGCENATPQIWVVWVVREVQDKGTQGMRASSILFHCPAPRSSSHIGRRVIRTHRIGANPEKSDLNIVLGDENWTQTFFSQTFRAPPGTSRQNPGISRPKSLISLVSRDIPNFLAPPPLHVEDPHPTRRYPDQKVWVWVPFSCLMSGGPDWRKFSMLTRPSV